MGLSLTCSPGASFGPLSLPVLQVEDSPMSSYYHRPQPSSGPSWLLCSLLPPWQMQNLGLSLATHFELPSQIVAKPGSKCRHLVLPCPPSSSLPCLEALAPRKKADLCFCPSGAGTLLEKTDKRHLSGCHRQPLCAVINKPELARLMLERVPAEKSVHGRGF